MMMANVLISAPSFRYDRFLNRHISRGADTNHVPSMLSYWLLWWRWGHKQTPVLGEEPSTTNQSSASARDQDITVRVGFVVHIRLVPSFLPTWHPDIMMASSTLTSHRSYCPGTPSLHLLPFNSTPVLHSCQLRFLLSQRKSNQVQTSATPHSRCPQVWNSRHSYLQNSNFRIFELQYFQISGLRISLRDLHVIWKGLFAENTMHFWRWDSHQQLPTGLICCWAPLLFCLTTWAMCS